MIMRMETRGYSISEGADFSVVENGCKVRKCPCRMWVNCPTYVDLQVQTLRLEQKKYDFEKWYRQNFRNDIQMQDGVING